MADVLEILCLEDAGHSVKQVNVDWDILGEVEICLQELRLRVWSVGERSSQIPVSGGRRDSFLPRRHIAWKGEVGNLEACDLDIGALVDHENEPVFGGDCIIHGNIEVKG